MARTISTETNKPECDTTLTKALQSGHINFLLGSGASMPAIATAGDIEVRLNKLLETSDDKGFDAEKHKFLSALQTSTNALIANSRVAANDATLDQYRQFLTNLSRILDERKTELLPKQITIFTTNYDLFVERAAEGIKTLRLNDGFLRNPAISESYTFQPEHYFDVTYKTGTLFKYRYPIPTVNLIKLHGSLSWRLSGSSLSYHSQQRTIPAAGSADVAAFLDSFCLVMPTKQKFSETLLTRVYYDLLRIFANALEVENTVLVCFGFSFQDEHIADIVTKALKNPTLLVLIVSYDDASVAAYRDQFSRYNNVVIVHPEGTDTIPFSSLNALLSSVVPKLSHEAR
ncbi:SIR2 family protein [Bradyrhizobium sp. 6(2017)]|uniref:SIR2 family protein n=1 Tax=Bradyrhizobium sp. 6(2017) TaxID=1197460 RepID=UPI0013E1C7FF|nr:SIR2 family protein [Bradyrhizobium sp. 6(2017)]QIG95510.1 hypothetical protein G6P99_25975 [Bradyrhizobium sp. 6(2017)]